MSSTGAARRLIVAITGASGVCYGVRALEMLRAFDDVEVHLIVSAGARLTLREEMDLTVSQVEEIGRAHV